MDRTSYNYLDCKDLNRMSKDSVERLIGNDKEGRLSNSVNDLELNSQIEYRAKLNRNVYKCVETRR